LKNVNVAIYLSANHEKEILCRSKITREYPNDLSLNVIVFEIKMIQVSML